METELRGAERFELLAELAVGAGAGLFELVDLGVYFFEGCPPVLMVGLKRCRTDLSRRSRR